MGSGKNMETKQQPGNEIRKKFKYGLRQKERYVKENAGKYECLMKLAKTYGCEIPRKDVESDGNEGGETGEQQGNNLRQRVGTRSRRGFGFGLNKMKKEWNCTGKIKILIEPSDENEMEMMKTKVEYDGEVTGVTSKAQQKKCEKPTSNTDMTNDS